MANKLIEFKIDINASAAEVWYALWNDIHYRSWTKIFKEGSYYVGDFSLGNKIQFLSPDGGGIFGIIDTYKENESITFKYTGLIRNFKEVSEGPETEEWQDMYETYKIIVNKTNVTLSTNLEAPNDAFEKYLNDHYPKAFEVIKQIAENLTVTISATINKPLEVVWNCFTNPEAIMKWNQASLDWHCPKAQNDLKVGGKFLYTMAAKDGSFGFDFIGTYTEIETDKRITYIMEDNRTCCIQFHFNNNTTKVTSTFDIEHENFPVVQEQGWQAILNSFKKYTENK